MGPHRPPIMIMKMNMDVERGPSYHPEYKKQCFAMWGRKEGEEHRRERGRGHHADVTLLSKLKINIWLVHPIFVGTGVYRALMLGLDPHHHEGCVVRMKDYIFPCKCKKRTCTVSWKEMLSKVWVFSGSQLSSRTMSGQYISAPMCNVVHLKLDVQQHVS